MPSQPQGPRALSVNATLNSVNGYSVPPSPRGAHPSSSMINSTKTLAEAWEDAKIRFKATTNKPIDGSTVDIDDFILKWADKYEVDNSDKARRKRKILGVIQNIIDGINVVGSIVAQGVSTTFGLAGPCFNALSFLLDAPRRVKLVYDTLLELFEEIEDFLVKFKILKRIDSAKRLPSEMVISAGKMLIYFIDVCGLSYKLLDGQLILTALKATFLNNDSGVGDALSRFRRMAQSLDSLTHTVAFENISEVKEVGQETNLIVKDNSATLKLLEQTSIEDKTNRVNQDRIKAIKEKIFKKEERSTDKVADSTDDLLPNTLTVLEQCREFCEWQDAPPHSGRAAFLLTGSGGSGKSRALEALKRRLDERQSTDSDKGELSILVAYHRFGGRVGKGANSLVSLALRNMAVQIAEQNPAYAKELESIVRIDKDADSIRLKDTEGLSDLWKTLKLSSFKIKSTEATMYLLFDGVEQETEDAIDALLNLFTGGQARKAETTDTLSVRAIFTIDPERQKTSFHVPTLDMSVATRDLIRPYVIRELKQRNIFQSNDKKSTKRREKILNSVNPVNNNSDHPQSAYSFKDVKQKLERIEAAISKDASSEELTKVLQDEEGQNVNPKARQALKDLAGSLTTREISQINQMLPWLLYSEYSDCLEIEELEAVIFLAHDSDSLQNLTTKMRGKFRDLFYREGSFVRLNAEMEKVLRESDENSSLNSQNEKSLISLELTIRNAEVATVQQFIWSLNEQMSTGKFDFSSFHDASRKSISVNKLGGHVCIVNTCLKLLNGGWNDETDILVRYAREFLPCHFIYLANNVQDILVSDQVAVSHSLVAFLSDPYFLAQDPDKDFGQGEHWLANSEATRAIKSWLGATQDHLQAREKRWAKAALDPSNGRLGYLRDVARAVGRKWLRHDKPNSAERETYTGVRASNSLEGSLFRWLNRYIENNQDNDIEESAVVEVSSQSESKFSADVKDTEQTEQQQQHPDHGELTPPQPAIEENSLSLTREQTVEEPSIADKIKRAVDWLQKNEVSCPENGIFHINVGYTYLLFADYERAEEHFEHAISDNTCERQGLTGLGRVYYARGQKAEAASKFADALQMYERQKLEKVFDSDQNKILAELYCELAAVYEERELMRLSEAIDLYEKSLECHDNLNNRWKALELLCGVNDTSGTERAVSLLDKWSDDVDEHGNKGLEFAIRRSATDDPTCAQLSLLIHAVRDSSIRSRLVDALSSAVQIEEGFGQSLTKVNLLYLQGLAIVRGPGEDRWTRAAELWSEVLAINIADDIKGWVYWELLYQVVVPVAQYEFDVSISKITQDIIMELSQEQKRSITEELEHNFQTRVFWNSNIPRYATQRATNLYLASLNIALGCIDSARELLVEDFTAAIEILSDDDADNDWRGIQILMRTLWATGDAIGALSAFSLLDRPSSASSAAGSRADLDFRITSYDAICDGCRKDVTSTKGHGFWWCQFCADFDLCPTCHDQASHGQINLPRCSMNHNLLLFYHTDYTDEEKVDNMVRIGWEREDLGSGKFARKGGRIVPLSEWLDELRREWKIPEPDKTPAQTVDV